MKTNGKTERDRKFYLMVPIIAIPFLTLLFWILGGGSAATGQESKPSDAALNTNLPDARESDGPIDKLSYYELAEKDSAKMLEQMRLDSNYRFSSMDSSRLFDSYRTQGYGGNGGAMANQLYHNLSQLEQQMQNGYRRSPQQWDDDYDVGYPQKSYPRHTAAYNVPEVDEMGSDPEIDQLNSMLDKIMEIQNPDLVNERLRESSEKRRGEVFAVSTPTKTRQVTLLDGSKSTQDNNGFFALDQNGFSDVPHNAIRAVVHQDQILTNGSTVKMRLVDEVFVNGVLIPKDNFLFGMAQLRGERLVIKIESLRYGKSLFPIALSVFDLDGIDGIYIPGSITRDAVKQSADRPLQSVNLGALDGSWGGQAAGAGLEMVKGLFSKKAKLIRVKVKAGYQILLRDEKQKSSLSK